MALIETIFGLVLGLITLLTIVQSYSSIDQFIRASGGQAEAQQRGAVASWRLLRELRMAGAGLGQGPTLWGCTVNAWRDGARFLPRAGAWPAPFANLPTTLMLTPMAVSNDTGPNGSDQLLFSTAQGSAGPAPAPATVVSAAMLRSDSSTGFRAGDLLLLADASGVGDCQVGQVDNSYVTVPGIAAPPIVPTGAAGAPFNSPAGYANLPQPGDYTMLNLGTTPSMQMIGVNAMGQLMLLDAMGIMTGAEPVVLAENVRQMQVLYGLDDGSAGGIANDNVVDQWVAPTGAWQFANLHSAATSALQVKSIRIAIVVRTETSQGRTGPASLTLFPDLPAAVQVAVPLTAAERGFQFQVYDAVIPLRNNAAALCAEHRRAGAVAAPSVCD